jgi:uncharacterized protein (DUF433 family)
MMQMTFEPQTVPLQMDEYGTIRIGGTRVRLDTVVYAFNQGHTVEEIVTHFPVLNLADGYAVITYYLNNKAVVDEYIKQGEEEAGELQYEFESQPGYQVFRERLLARKERHVWYLPLMKVYKINGIE